jgi:hypothetical protein
MLRDLLSKSVGNVFIGPSLTAFEMEPGEFVVYESYATRSGNMSGGGNVGPVLLTDRRLRWRANEWPRLPGDVNVWLSEIRVAERPRNHPLDWLSGGPSYWLRLHDGKSIKFYWCGDEEELPLWLDRLNRAIKEDNGPT